jgi:hypothetical protein
MTKAEWIKKYEEKTGDMHELLPGYTEQYLPDRGYCQYGVDTKNNSLVIYETCGDGKFWYDVGLLICSEKRLNRLITIVTRDIRAHLRFFGGKVEKENVAADGSYRISGINHIGRPFFVFPAWFDNKKNKYAYYLITEVGECDVF